MEKSQASTFTVRFSIHDIVNDLYHRDMSWFDALDWIENKYPLVFGEKCVFLFSVLGEEKNEKLNFNFIPFIGNGYITIGLVLYKDKEESQ